MVGVRSCTCVSEVIGFVVVPVVPTDFVLKNSIVSCVWLWFALLTAGIWTSQTYRLWCCTHGRCWGEVSLHWTYLRYILNTITCITISPKRVSQVILEVKTRQSKEWGSNNTDNRAGKLSRKVIYLWVDVNPQIVRKGCPDEWILVVRSIMCSMNTRVTCSSSPHQYESQYTEVVSPGLSSQRHDMQVRRQMGAR